MQKPSDQDPQKVDEYLTQLQVLWQNEMFQFYMQYIREQLQASFGLMLQSKDPTEIVKEVGKTAALKDVSSWLQREIDATLRIQEEMKEARKTKR